MGENQVSVAGSPNSPTGQSPGIENLVGDEEIRKLIAKRTSGDRLSPRENGRLGAWAAKTGSKLPGRPPKNDSPQNLDANGGRDISVEVQALPPSVELCVKNTLRTLLDTADDIKAATVAGKTAKIRYLSQAQVADFSRRAKMGEGSANVLVESSPAVLQSLNIPLDKFPIGAFLAVIAAEGTRFASLIAELNKLAAEQAKLDGAESKRQASENKVVAA